MRIQKGHVLFRAITLILAISLFFPCSVAAATADILPSRASEYLTSYNTYACAMGSGRVEIWFTVVGDTDMDDIGALSIRLYESTDNSTWTWKQTYLHEDYPSMLAHNDYFHSSCVSYQGVAGRYYKAYVCIWAGKDGGGDTRYMWATSVKAT